MPLFEALNWAASIDLFFAEGGNPIENDLLTGVRFARNRIHHQWAKALGRHENPGMLEVTLALTSSRLTGPRPGFWWHWADAGELPPWKPSSVKPPVGENQYTEYLAGRSVDRTLEALRPVLEDLI